MSCVAYIVYTFHLFLPHANFGQFKVKQVLLEITCLRTGHLYPLNAFKGFILVKEWGGAEAKHCLINKQNDQTNCFYHI